MDRDVWVDVAILGGGFAGTMVAANLLGNGREPRTIALVERTPPPGRGVAYGSPDPLHLLNVPAGEMSAWPDDPGHFVRWLAAAGVPLGERDFAPRGLYGRYVGEVLDAAIAAAPAGRTLVAIADEAIGLLPASGGYRIRLASGRYVTARQVVLAIGQAPPAPLRAAAELPASAAGDPVRFVPDPWSAAAVAPLTMPGEVLLVGTGLTAVDVAVALLVHGGATRVTLVSRRARLPAAQRQGPAYEDWLDLSAVPMRVTALLARFREEVHRAAARGFDWRAVLDAMRPHVPALWGRLPLVERRRFLRHLRTLWETHRNRLPPPTAERLEAFRAEGRLEVQPARLRGLAPVDGGLAATLVLPGGEVRTATFARVVNCTGPELFYKRGAHPLVQDVIGTGLGRLDPLGLGLDVAPDFRLLDEDGRPTPGVYALGAPAKGRWWETMAVSELREHAREVAARL